MSYRLVIRPQADRDLDDHAMHIASDNLDAGLRFYDAARVTFDSIADAPMAGRIFEIGRSNLGEIRKRNIRKFANFLVFYRVHDDHVEIIRVLHGARDLPAALQTEWNED